jgi:hypothetical protein
MVSTQEPDQEVLPEKKPGYSEKAGLLGYDYAIEHASRYLYLPVPMLSTLPARPRRRSISTDTESWSEGMLE